MKCPECKRNVGLVDIIKEWDSLYGSDVELAGNFPVYINLICTNCDESVGAIFIERADKPKKVKIKEGPLKGKEVEINIPK